MSTEIPKTSKDDSAEIKDNINFFMKHLSVKELHVLESVAHSLSNQYSESYYNWKHGIKPFAPNN